MSRSQVQVLVTAMVRLILIAVFFTLQIGANEELTDAVLPRLDRTVQNEFYQTLKALDSLFDEAGIEYWVTAGTLLGAIRHGEMIPWDDDIDLALFIDDLGKVVSLRPELEKRGLCLLVKRDYAKIFPKEGKQIAHPDGDFYPHRYPFIDLFFMTREAGKILPASMRLREGFKNDWLESETTFVRKPFGPLTVPVPTRAGEYLERRYGEDCWEWAYADYDHAAEQKRERIKVKIRKS
ncbi:MAG: LicD family protein [Chlamydiales bacterium]|nr:LicD family protein [Chlamydiales bacterium]